MSVHKLRTWIVPLCAGFLLVSGGTATAVVPPFQVADVLPAAQGMVSGQVLAPAGATGSEPGAALTAAAGGQVVLLDLGLGRELGCSATTGADGSFSFADCPALATAGKRGPLLARFSMPHSQIALAAVVPADGSPLRITPGSTLMAALVQGVISNGVYEGNERAAAAFQAMGSNWESLLALGAQFDQSPAVLGARSPNDLLIRLNDARNELHRAVVTAAGPGARWNRGLRALAGVARGLRGGLAPDQPVADQSLRQQVQSAIGKHLAAGANLDTPIATNPVLEGGEVPPEPQPLPITSDLGSSIEFAGAIPGNVYPLAEGADRLPASFDGLQPVAHLYADHWDVPTRSFSEGFPGAGERFEWFAIVYKGKINVTGAGGPYHFRLSSDDGTKLFIDRRLVIDNDGVHATSDVAGDYTLASGPHEFELQYFQGPRYEIALQLFATPPGGTEGIFRTDGSVIPPRQP